MMGVILGHVYMVYAMGMLPVSNVQSLMPFRKGAWASVIISLP